MNSLQRRHEQKLNWNDSETDKASSAIRQAKRIGFDNTIKFLSACRNFEEDEIKALLSTGLSIDVCNSDGLTALHRACLYNNLEVVQFLVEHGADLNKPDSEGVTPLHDAVISGYVEIVKYLVEKGARLDALSNENELPIDVVNEEDTEIHTYLTKCMAEQHINPEEVRNREKCIMLEHAERWLREKLYRPLEDPVTRATPLHISASKNYVDVMEKLLQIPQVDVNAIDLDGWTPLHLAAHWGNREACEMLIKHGADVKATTFTNQSVLDVASSDLEDFLKDESNKTEIRNRPKRPSMHRISTSEKQQLLSKATVEEAQTLRDSVILDTTLASSVPSIPPITSLDTVVAPSSQPVSNKVNTNKPANTVTGKSEVPPSLETLPAVMKTSAPPPVPAFRSTAPLASVSITTPISSTSTVSQISSHKPPPIPTVKSDDMFVGDQENDSPVELRPRRRLLVPAEDAASSRLSAVLAPEKGEKEAQRTSKARHARATRRSTQGVTLEDLNTAKSMNVPPAISVVSAGISTVSSTAESKPVPPPPSTLPTVEELRESIASVRNSTENSPLRSSSMRGSSFLDDDDESLTRWVEIRKNRLRNAASSEEVQVKNGSTTLDGRLKPRESQDKSLPQVTSPPATTIAAVSLTTTDGPSRKPPPPIPTSVVSDEPRSAPRPTSNYLRSAAAESSSSSTTVESRATSTVVVPVGRDAPAATSQQPSSSDYETLYRHTLAEKTRLQTDLTKLQAAKEASDEELARLRSAQTPSYEELVKMKRDNAKMKEENVSLLSVIHRLSTGSGTSNSSSSLTGSGAEMNTTSTYHRPLSRTPAAPR